MKSMLTDVIKTNKQKAELTCLGLTILIVMLVFMMVGTTAVSFLAAFFYWCSGCNLLYSCSRLCNGCF